MASNFEVYGFQPHNLLTSADDVWLRLNAILSDKVLRFNPFSVNDNTLIECSQRAKWLPFPSLTQMVVFHFHDIRRICAKIPYNAISFHIGNNPQEMLISVNALTRKLTYTATLQQIHICTDGHPLTNEKTVQRMQGNSYFVSHALPALTPNRLNRPAYRMFRLKGDNCKIADTIRSQMIDAKITMLKEIIAHPYTPQYLRCSRNFIDYSSHIQDAINEILNFKNV